MPVNPLEGHIYAAWLLAPGEPDRPEPEFPLVALVVSGGHTFLVEMQDHLRYRLLGQTVDDAAGEAFDKVGRLLGLPYPGGPSIEKAARSGDPKTYWLPRPLLDDPERLDFSFSGLKTAVRYLVQPPAKPGEPISERQVQTSQEIADIAACFQDAAIDCLLGKAELALKRSGFRVLCVGGGVAANGRFRARLEESAAANRYEPLCCDPAFGRADRAVADCR